MFSPNVRSPRWLALIAVALLLSSCFEPPIDESLQLRFLPNGAVVLTSTVEFAGQERQGNPALERRLAQARQAVLEGWDPWSQRFAAIDPAAERFSWEKRLGELHKGTRSAVVMEPESLRRFFGDTALSVSYEIRDNVAELVITPGPPSGATRRQRQEMKRFLDDWSGRVAEYLAAGEDLYRYLDDRPDRARDCLGGVFEDLLGEKDRERLDLFDQEKDRVKRVKDAMEDVLDVLLVPKGSDHSPDEISHLVYDPFPARLTVRLPGPPLETPEGFEPALSLREELVAEGPGLWQALQSLEGRWLSPDLALVYVVHDRQSQDEPFDLDGLVTEPRRASKAPTDREVKLAIEERLQPAPLYRVTFAVQPEEEGEDAEPFDWEG